MSKITYYKWHTCMNAIDFQACLAAALCLLIVDIFMVVFVLPVLCSRVIEVIKAHLSPSHSHTGPTQHMSLKDIGVRANIHLGGQNEFCPNGFSGGGGSSRNFPGSKFSGGGGWKQKFSGSIFCGVAEFFPLTAVADPKFGFFPR